MRMIIYFACLVILWITFIPALNTLRVASDELTRWFVAINVVITVKLIIDIHNRYIDRDYNDDTFRRKDTNYEGR